MPILLKTWVECTAKTPLPRRRARGGGLCGFRGAAERVPAGSPKTGRCAAVRERWQKTSEQDEMAAGKAACSKCGNTPKRAKSRAFGRRGEKAGQSRGVVRVPAAVTSARRAGSFGDLRGRSKSREKQLEGVAVRKKSVVSRKTAGFQRNLRGEHRKMVKGKTKG